MIRQLPGVRTVSCAIPVATYALRLQSNSALPRASPHYSSRLSGTTGVRCLQHVPQARLRFFLSAQRRRIEARNRRFSGHPVRSLKIYSYSAVCAAACAWQFVQPTPCNHAFLKQHWRESGHLGLSPVMPVATKPVTDAVRCARPVRYGRCRLMKKSTLKSVPHGLIPTAVLSGHRVACVSSAMSSARIMRSSSNGMKGCENLLSLTSAAMAVVSASSSVRLRARQPLSLRLRVSCACSPDPICMRHTSSSLNSKKIRVQTTTCLKIRNRHPLLLRKIPNVCSAAGKKHPASETEF